MRNGAFAPLVSSPQFFGLVLPCEPGVGSTCAMLRGVHCLLALGLSHRLRDLLPVLPLLLLPPLVAGEALPLFLLALLGLGLELVAPLPLARGLVARPIGIGGDPPSIRAGPEFPKVPQPGLVRTDLGSLRQGLLVGREHVLAAF